MRTGVFKLRESGSHCESGRGEVTVSPESPVPRAGLPQASSWVLDFRQERFHHMDPVDFERMFIKVGDSETKKGLG